MPIPRPADKLAATRRRNESRRRNAAGGAIEAGPRLRHAKLLAEIEIAAAAASIIPGVCTAALELLRQAWLLQRHHNAQEIRAAACEHCGEPPLEPPLPIGWETGNVPEAVRKRAAWSVITDRSPT